MYDPGQPLIDATNCQQASPLPVLSKASYTSMLCPNLQHSITHNQPNKTHALTLK